ncbi:MAG: hypothetical protein QXD89_00730 [Candidatus Aenigmatarchaeota archaeon]
MFLKKEKKDDDLERKLKEIEMRIKGNQLTSEQQKEINQQSSKDKIIEENLQKETQEKINIENKEVEEVSAPLFIKLDKYKNLVSSLMQLKTYLITLKNTIVAIEQLEKVRMESISTLSKTIEKMNEKISELEKYLVKPIGFTFGPTETMEELFAVQSTLSSLKTQIENLKSELEKT